MKLLQILAFAMAAVAVRVHQAPELANGWQVESNEVIAKEDVEFTLAVREQNMDKIKRTLERVSNPKSSEYTNYLNSQQVLSLTRPLVEDLLAVTNWLSANQVKFEVELGRYVHVKASVSQAESLLSTNFRTLVNSETDKSLVRASDFYLPDEVEYAVAAVFGLHGLPLPPKKTLVTGGIATVTPSVLASTYSISGVTPQGSDTNRQAVAEFQGQTEKDSDLASFFKQFVPKYQDGDDKVSKFVGDPDQQFAGIEASLDIQYIMGVAPHVKTEFWYWQGNDFCKDLVNWTTTMLADDAAPNVHSVSYGWQGSLSQIGCHDADVSVVDANFAKLATKGITIVFASGDSGSGYSPYTVTDAIKLYPSWPASSPYVTAVGATRFVNQKVGEAEMASDQFGSGGGFSDMWNQTTDAKWQVDAVKHYTSNPPDDPAYPPAGSFNPNGRATPDVSALGEGYSVITNGYTTSVGGTSASAPAFAGMVALLNDARAQASKKPLGFLNPFLYQNADAFTDVTLGTNAIGRGTGPIKYGFKATAGWDPATGLGTPIFSKLLTAATSA